jgi:hypothetical protein
MIVPGGTATPEQPKPMSDSPVLKALIRAHRWRRLFEAGQFASIAELAAAEKVDKSYLSKVLRLTILAPDLAEDILNQHEHFDVSLERLLSPFPPQWDRQRQILTENGRPDPRFNVGF